MAAEEIKRISVIIVAFKNGDILENALDKLYRYNDIGDDLEVIVVDNSPENEEVYDFVCRSDFQTCKYIKAQNKGFGAGNNLGVKEASGEILAFINPDVYLVEPIFKDVYSFFQDDNNFFICLVIKSSGFTGLLLKFLVCLLVPNILCFLFFSHSKEFKNTFPWIRSILTGYRNRKKDAKTEF